nr:ATP synthase F1 subunit gamma [Bacilli bacterium]
MPQNTRDIRRRIKSVQNTAQITKAMEMVSAAKLRKVQDAVLQAKPYLKSMEDMLAAISYSARHVKHPLLESRPVKKTAYLVITADRGLAGAYNANVIRRTTQEIRKVSKNEYTIFAVGRRGRDFFRRANIPITAEMTGLPDAPTYESVRSLAEQIVEGYGKGDYDALYIVYNEFVNAVTNRTVAKQVLPLTREESQVKANEEYLYERDSDAVLAKLLPRFAETLMYQAVLDAKASEHGSRMASMGNATDSAHEMIGNLTLQLNRARQAAITTQIAEVVGGAEALK